MADYVIEAFPAPFIVSDTNAQDYVFETVILNEQQAAVSTIVPLGIQGLAAAEY